MSKRLLLQDRLAAIGYTKTVQSQPLELLTRLAQTGCTVLVGESTARLAQGGPLALTSSGLIGCPADLDVQIHALPHNGIGADEIRQALANTLTELGAHYRYIGEEHTPTHAELATRIEYRADWPLYTIYTDLGILDVSHHLWGFHKRQRDALLGEATPMSIDGVGEVYVVDAQMLADRGHDGKHPYSEHLHRLWTEFQGPDLELTAS